MNASSSHLPRPTRCLVGLVVVAFVALLATLLGPVDLAAAAGERAGDVVVVSPSGETLGSGGSATPFGLRVPSGAACQGDSAAGSYRVEAFMVPTGTDPASLVYGELAPEGENAWGLWDTNTESFDGGLTAQADPGRPGLIVDLPNFSWGVLLPGEMKPGDYRIGIACSLFNETTRYWDTTYTVVSDVSDEPGQFRWTAAPLSETSSTGSSGSSSALLAGVLVVLVLAVAIAFLLVRSRSGRTSPPKERSS